MKKNRDDFFLKHIVMAFENVFSYINGISCEEFLRNNLIKDAVVRNFEIIGEATKNLTVEFRQSYPDIDWKGLAGYRDILIHQYFGIDYLMVWNMSQKEARITYNKVKVIHSCIR